MSAGLTFFQARAISQQQNLHVRRESWADPNQWFLCWRGFWWYFTTGIARPVQATDYTSAELLATDWTTVPEALEACPVDATIGSTGGAPPPAGGSLFATSLATVDTTQSGSGGGGGGGSGGSSLPPTPDGIGVSVTVGKTTAGSGAPSVNGTFLCTGSGHSWAYTGSGFTIRVVLDGSGGATVAVNSGRYGAISGSGSIGTTIVVWDTTGSANPTWDGYYGAYAELIVLA